jgi:ribulose-5-phosphate 4-epimerase/fuculose-1-phosphate aldolase
VGIHDGHGIFTTGQSLDEAAWWFVLMNRCWEAQLMAEACGKPSTWAAEDARWLASVLGSPQLRDSPDKFLLWVAMQSSP